MQAKFDELSRIVEAQVNKTDSFRVLMVGDSTIKHQFGAMCAFLGESQRSVFDTGVGDARTGRMTLYDRVVFSLTTTKTCVSQAVRGALFFLG